MNNKIIVTGAAGDIGSEICKQASKKGYERIGTDIKGGKDIQRLDITKPQDIELFFKQYKSSSDFPNVLVNNAGIYLGRNLQEYSVEEILSVINVNLLGTILMTQKFIGGILYNKMQGQVINISSIAGENGGSDAVYSATKSALMGFTKSIDDENIVADILMPGLVSGTGMEARVPKNIISKYSDTLVLAENVAEIIISMIGDKTYRNGEMIELI